MWTEYDRASPEDIGLPLTTPFALRNDLMLAALAKVRSVDIALASSSADHANDTDLPRLIKAAEDLGHRAQVVVWDDPSVDWAAFDRVAIRSCWDYTKRREEFLRWTKQVGSRLVNFPEVISWNSDKVYLRDLAAADVAIIPTFWDVNDSSDLGEHASWVVKPTVSAGAANTAHWTDPEAAVRHSLELLAAGRSTMAQPYVKSIDTVGEFAIYMFNGEFSHAVRKPALLEADRSPDAEISFPGGLRAITIHEQLLRFAHDTVAAAEAVLEQSLVQARVDVVLDDDGRGQLMELELVEPALFLDHEPETAARYIDAVATS